jgi:superfamily II DNA/RNA helicase
MHPGDKDLITAQITARNGKTILFVKTQRGDDRLADNLAKADVPVSALHGGKSKHCAPAHSKHLKNKKTQPSPQPMSPPAVSMSMASH